MTFVVVAIAVLFVAVVFPATCAFFCLKSFVASIRRSREVRRLRHLEKNKDSTAMLKARNERDRILTVLEAADLRADELEVARRTLQEDYREQLDQIFRHRFS